MDTLLGRYRNLIVLAAILFAQLIGLALQVRRPTQQGEVRLIRLWAISAVTPFEKVAIHAQNGARNLWSNYLYLRGVRRENRELRAELERMKIEQTRLAEDARMAQRVQALLGFKEQYVESTVAAQVIGTSGSDQSRILYIDKGSHQGIKLDMAVITPTGIVGKIVQVFPEASQVLPINDQFSGVGAALKESRLQGILKGSPNGATTLQYIMSDEKVTPGEEIITSGGDRIYPKGLPVGRVATVEPGKDLFLNIRVIPSAQLDRVEEVLVVTKVTEHEPDTAALGRIRAADVLAERLPTVPVKPAPADATKPAAGNVPQASSAGTGSPAAATSGTATAGHPAPGTAGVRSKPVTGVTNNLGNTPQAGTAPRTSTVPPSNGATAKPKPPATAPGGTAARTPREPSTTTTQPGEAPAAAQDENAVAPKPRPAKEPAVTPPDTTEQPAKPPAEPPQL